MSLTQSLQRNMREFSHYHIKNVILDYLHKNDISQETWGAHLIDFVTQAVENVRPSSRMMGDGMDINKYIKIKIIHHCDNSKS